MLAVISVLSDVSSGIVSTFAKIVLSGNVGMYILMLFNFNVMLMIENKMLIAAKEGCELLFIKLHTCCSFIV